MLPRHPVPFKDSVNRYILPNMFALATFIGAFWPLARRAGPHARIWLLGWSFIFVHYVAQIGRESGLPHQDALRLVALWGTELCALCFVRAAGDAPLRPLGRLFLVEMAVPVVLQSTLLTYGIDAYFLRIFVALLFFGPVIHLLLRPAPRPRPLLHLAIGFSVLAVVSIALAGQPSADGVRVTLCFLFLFAAWLSFAGAVRFTRGVAVAVAGLAGWGITYLLRIVFAMHNPILGPDNAFFDLPQYVVAYGMILSLLEEHLGRTEQLALIDALTGLPNTRHFEDRFSHALAMSSQHGNPIACMVIDVDRFKQVNDTLGHPVGDELLKALAVRLAWHIGPRDTLARSGGDEFIALLVSENDEYHLQFIARAMMSAASVPVSVLGHSIAVTMSVGIAISPRGDEGLIALRKAADDAMYEAKRNGGGQLVIASEMTALPGHRAEPSPISEALR